MRARIAYRPGESLLHKLNPLVKLAWVLVLTIWIFWIREAVWIWILLLVLGVLLWSLKPGKLPGLRLLITTGILLAVLQMIFVDSGPVIFTVGPVSVTGEGLLRGGYVAGRFLTVIILSYIFVLTTSPNDLAYSLMRAGLPYRFGFTLVTALRLIPLFEQEANQIYQAQRVRGVAYDRANIKNLLRSIHQLLLPMLISALSKVDALAISMEGRSYGRYPDRTYFQIRDKTPGDIWFGLGAGVWLLLMIFWKLMEVIT
jgi:energy-coupling factor transport system permease protein